MGNKVELPYYIADDSLKTSSFIGILENAMREIETHSRILFQQMQTNQESCLRIISGNGCYFKPYDCFGRYPRTCQPSVSFQKGCRIHGTILHELLHAVGFQHEHQRPDRDNYVEIFKDNIAYDDTDQFTPLPKSEFVWSVDDFEFDYDSIMLYDEFAFSANKGRTMKGLGGRTLSSTKNGLSMMDKAKLKSL